MAAARPQFSGEFDKLADTEDVDIASDKDSASVTYKAGGVWELGEVNDKRLIDAPLPFLEEGE